MFKNNELSWREITILVVIAYIFSFAVRLIWVWQFKDASQFYWNGQLMINTNDGYFFASAVEYLLNGAHADNPRVHIAINSYPAMVYISYFLAKFTPMSLETTILYAPAIISSLVVIPIILMGKLIRLPWVGFFGALLGSIAWSYYNRTMIGYYDTDMFSVLLQTTILYLFLLTIYHKDTRNILILAIFLILYPLFYPQGLSLIYAMFILWVIYQLVFQRDELNSYLFIAISSIALWNIDIYIKLLFVFILFFSIDKIEKKLDKKQLFYFALISIFMFFVFGNVFGLIFEKVTAYMDRGVTEEGLHFYQVIQTVREAGSISWETVANRIVGGFIPLAISVIGYILLVIKHRAFLIALPLIGVGVFAHWAGLRFTVYAVSVASFVVVYFFWIVAEKFIKDKKAQIAFSAILTAGVIYPNIMHIIGYKVPTVMNKMEVEDLNKLSKIASPRDYTLSWWDYGYPIWFYSDTSTLIDGAKHNNDNFIISKILFSTSQEQVANLSRLAVETYVDSNYSVVSNKIFTIKKNPKILLNDLKKSDFKLPPKTRDIYLYMPYRMMNIFPTIGVFGNLDLMTGRKERQIVFYPTSAIKQAGSKIIFRNGIVFDSANGTLRLGKSIQKVYCFDQVRLNKNFNPVVQSSIFHIDGNFCIVNLQDYGRTIIMDKETYNSAYVQMFMLGKYDKKLFDLVVSSPYTKIFKIKK